MSKQLYSCSGEHGILNRPECEQEETCAQKGIEPLRAQGADDGISQKEAAIESRYHTLDQENRLIWNLRDIGHTIRFLSEGKGSQSRILIILRGQEEMSQRELTERLDIQPGSASEVIKKMEAAGLLTRTPSGKDRRTSVIRLTEEGRVKAEEAALRRRQRHTEMFSCLSEEEKAGLLTLLEKMNRDWRLRYGKRAAHGTCFHDGSRNPDHKEG